MLSNLSAARPLSERRLLVIGSNPSTTSGLRTLGRVDKACQVLGFDDAEIANLFGVPTYRTGDISSAGSGPLGWQKARPQLKAALKRATAVILAYGISKPTGAAKIHHAEQVIWLENEIQKRDLPTWTVGGAPRHPSRWQRYTYREYPSLGFLDALRASMTPHEFGTTRTSVL